MICNLNLSRGKTLSILIIAKTSSGATQLLIYWVLRGVFLVVNWLGREADCSLPSSSKIKNRWSCTSTVPMFLHGMYKDLLH